MVQRVSILSHQFEIYRELYNYLNLRVKVCLFCGELSELAICKKPAKVDVYPNCSSLVPISEVVTSAIVGR
jgi:hypothetical protein